ncbi:glycoside hydrolase family 43 protein [Pedobacter rhodius]|uniref:Glycoside hydrolase 43 family protein n=1 Tax=Pedobacter rhodius TaxID=3004098 RepID=A0ABT4KTV8_9SPHI|nr:glycoside hydrolase 43 family protein [Pedobacter sp. SJ11]MCZ4222181.1 glycoside hydrolase 43 family protein [Pedobacter sp. SJ11]
MQRTILIYFIVFIFANTHSFAQINNQTPIWGQWENWGDTGNGTYNNPVLPADYSDLDCIRVGTDYYAVSSTFQYSPGFVILHSKDMVNWEIISHAVNDITSISAEMNWDKMNRYGKGIWAGAIRYHNKKFWIYFGTPDEGYFMTTAEKPEGPWQPLHQVLAKKGWDDCSPFWDDDGQGYLVGTNFSDGYKIHLFKMTADGKELIEGSDKVIHQSEGSEANKLYKINGIYYHFFSEVKPEGRAIMMERANNIYGPYTEEKQLSHAEKNFNEPNQGGMVQTQNGDWYFLTHHGTGDWSGRIMSLLPVNWIDGWPIIGKVGQDKIGSMVWSGKKPVNPGVFYAPQTSDEFSQSNLPQQWEWNYHPRTEKWSLKERAGWLRLHAFKPIETNNLLKAGNTLTQRTYRTKTNEVIIKLDFSGIANGQKAGLSHFGSPAYATLGIACEDKISYLEFNIKGKITKGPVLKGKKLWLKSTWGLDGKSQFYYSINGKKYMPFGKPYQMEWGSYRGDRIAIYSYNNLADEGYIDVDYFHYTYGK